MTDETKRLVPYVLLGSVFSMPLMCLMAVVTYMRSAMLGENYRPRYFLYFMFALVPALINTTKPVDFSDLGYYYWLFNFAGEKTFFEFFMLIPKEPLYHVYTYVMHYLTFGSFKLFVIATSLLMYMPVMIAYDIIVRKNGLPIQLAIFSSLLLLLFPQFFFYTMQIVRQVLAGSIAFYCVVRSLYYPRGRWALAGVFCAGFIHASAFIFSCYYVFRYVESSGIYKKMLVAVVLGVFFYSILGFISGAVDESSTIAYAAQRGLENTLEKTEVRLFPRLVSLSILPLGLFVAIKLKDNIFVSFIAVSWIIVGFIISKWDSALIVLRFMEYTYMYIPLLTVLTLYFFDKLFYIIKASLVVMSAVFLRSVVTSDFSYESPVMILLKGSLFYFL